MVQDSPGSGQPREREEWGWSSVPRGNRPAVMQPGTGPGRRAQGHTGQEEPQIQSSAGLEAIHTAIPPPGLNSQVREGRAASSWNQGAGP